MNRNEELETLKTEYQKIKAPKDGIKKVESAIRRAKVDKVRRKRMRVMRSWGVGVAAALVLIALPNTNENIAYAMGNLPIVGGLFRVVTVRDFHYDDGKNMANVNVPQILTDDTEKPENSEAAAQVNKSVEEYINRLISQFQSDLSAEGFKELDISYETVMDTDKWFTLKLTALEIQASGYEVHRYYHIDKENGIIAGLKDLFVEGADYITPISEEIKKQMSAQMQSSGKVYFTAENQELKDGFSQIEEDQNFYLDTDGNIVIVFDEYEVGPGSTGSPEFKIPANAVSSIRK